MLLLIKHFQVNRDGVEVHSGLALAHKKKTSKKDKSSHSEATVVIGAQIGGEIGAQIGGEIGALIGGENVTTVAQNQVVQNCHSCTCALGLNCWRGCGRAHVVGVYNFGF
jgi:hypothetical protein